MLGQARPWTYSESDVAPPLTLSTGMLWYNVHFLKYLFIYLSVPGLGCKMWDLQSSLQHVGSLVAACGI